MNVPPRPPSMANVVCVFDSTRRYRYRWEQHWGDGPLCLFVMLNPSTADEDKTDPTVRRCIAFAKREGCGGLIVCNLYAFRSTDPAGLLAVDDPRGPDNEQHIREAAKAASLRVAAWGSNHLGGAWPHRVKAILAEAGPVHLLRRTAGGDPGHPLYIPGAAPLVQVAP